MQDIQRWARALHSLMKGLLQCTPTPDPHGLGELLPVTSRQMSSCPSGTCDEGGTPHLLEMSHASPQALNHETKLRNSSSRPSKLLSALSEQHKPSCQATCLPTLCERPPRCGTATLLTGPEFRFGFEALRITNSRQKRCSRIKTSKHEPSMCRQSNWLFGLTH